jgi:hypothetical protein
VKKISSTSTKMISSPGFIPSTHLPLVKFKCDTASLTSLLLNMSKSIERLNPENLDPSALNFLIQTSKNLKNHYSTEALLPQWVNTYSSKECIFTGPIEDYNGSIPLTVLNDMKKEIGIPYDDSSKDFEIPILRKRPRFFPTPTKISFFKKITRRLIMFRDKYLASQQGV